MELGELNIHIGDGNYSSKYPKNSEFLDEGVPFISASDFQGRVFIADGMKYVSEEQHSVLLKGHLKPRDILVVVRGNGCGKVGLVPAEYDNANINAQLVLLRCDNQTVNSEYLYYLLSTNEYQNKLKALCSGSAQPQLPIKSLKKLQLELPKYEMQLKIAGVAKIIDDKMLNNAAINRNLSEQARLLYKSWFIDFNNNDGVMPDDWHVGAVSEIIELHDSKRKPLSGNERDKLEKIYPYYGATSIMDYVDDYLFDGIYLLLGEDGSVIDSDGYPILQYVFGKFWCNNHAHIITGKNGFSVEMLYLLFSLTHVNDIVTGAVQLKISQQNLNKVEVVIPSLSALKEFDELIQPMFGQIRKLRLENENLTTLRDSLLPKLMSGELDVSNLNI